MSEQISSLDFQTCCTFELKTFLLRSFSLGLLAPFSLSFTGLRLQDYHRFFKIHQISVLTQHIYQRKRGNQSSFGNLDGEHSVGSYLFPLVGPQIAEILHNRLKNSVLSYNRIKFCCCPTFVVKTGCCVKVSLEVSIGKTSCIPSYFQWCAVTTNLKVGGSKINPCFAQTIHKKFLRIVIISYVLVVIKKFCVGLFEKKNLKIELLLVH